MRSIGANSFKGGEIMKKLYKPKKKYDLKLVVAYTGENGIGCNCC